MKLIESYDVIEDSYKLTEYLEEERNPTGESPLITNKILLARTIVCDELNKNHFTAIANREEWGEIIILNPDEEQIKELEEVKKVFCWIKTENLSVEL